MNARFLLFESAVDDLHADGVVRSALQSHAIHAHIMCHTYLVSVAISVTGGTYAHGDQYCLVPVWMSLLPFFFADVLLGHAVFLFLLAEADETTDVAEGVCVVRTAV